MFNVFNHVPLRHSPGDSYVDKAIKTIQEKYGLNYQQARFCHVYQGNGTLAARNAGYKGNDKTLAVQASRLLKDERVKAALASRATTTDPGKPLTPDQILSTWTTMAQDSTVPASIRIKALENCARSLGMFIDKVAIKGQFEHTHLDRLSDKELLDQLGQCVQVLSDLSVLALPEKTG